MKYRYLYLLLFLYLWLMLGFRLSLLESPTFDEPIHLKAAVEYQKGNFDFDPIEPPLLRRTVYYLGQKIEKITGPSLTLFPYRASIVILTGLAFCLLLWSLFNYSAFAGLLASVLIVYEPNLVAHSHYFTTDALSAIISLIAARLILIEFWRRPRNLVLIALFVALAASIKVATLSLLLPLLIIKSVRLGKGRLVFLIIFCTLFIWWTYSFRPQVLGNFLDLKLPFGGYLRAIKENILFVQRGQPIFFYGTLFQKAPWSKTIIVLLFKTSLPLMILAFWGLIKGKTKKHLLLIFLLAILVGLFKPLNFGMRHLLIVEIILILFAAKVQPRTVANWLIFSILIFWQIFTFWRVLPQPITYTNELVTRPAQIFTDSDFDWGQGLIQLSAEINRLGLANYQLAYFGNNDPANYLTNFTPISTPSSMNYYQPAIISVTCYYQCGYSANPHFSQLPKKLIAKSFFYFP